MKLDDSVDCGGKPVVCETNAIYVSYNKCDSNVDRSYHNLKTAHLDWNRKQKTKRNRE